MSCHSKALKELQKIWYDKLKQEGFIDIEDSSRIDRPLQTWHSLKFQNLSGIQFESTTEYYYKAKELLNTYEFKNETQRRIWELHCEGKSKRKIEVEIKHFEKTYKREWIGVIIQRIRSEIK